MSGLRRRIDDANRHKGRGPALGVGMALMLSVVVAGYSVGQDPPTVEEQIAALNEELLGPGIPEDPDELRARNAEYERRFAEIGVPAVPVDEGPIEEDPPYPFPTGVFEPTDSFSSTYRFQNYWNGIVAGERVTVFAGSLTDDPEQGGVAIMPYGEGPSPFYRTPVKAGPLRIASVESDILTLLTDDGVPFLFNVSTASYVPTP